MIQLSAVKLADMLLQSIGAGLLKVGTVVSQNQRLKQIKTAFPHNRLSNQPNFEQLH